MPNTKEQYKEFLKKKQMGAPVSIRDLAVRADNEEESLFDLMIQNDLPQMNALLHDSDAPFFIGQNANFIPDANAVAAEMKQLLIRKDFNIINSIIGGFVWNKKTQNFTNDPKLLQEMQLIGTLGTDAKGNLIIRNRVIS